jgi:DNA-binding beta-propeller fold protein YncE
MSSAQRGRSVRRGYGAAGASLLALALGGALASTASAATTPPNYTIVEATTAFTRSIDNATDAVGPALAGAAAVAISPDGQTAYLVQGGGLTPVTLSTGAVGAQIPLASGGDALAISPNGALAYVANSHNGTVTPVPLPGGPAGTPIAVSTPINLGVAFSADGKFAYVLGDNAAITTSTVTPINVATGQALPAIPLANLTFGGIKISPDGKTAYVSSSNRPVVDTIDLTTNTLGPQISLVSAAGGFPQAAAVTLSPDGKTLYAATNIGVVVVNLTTGTAAAPIPYGGDFLPVDIAITPDGRTLYISQNHRNQNSFTPAEVLPIDVASGVVGTPIVTDTNPNAGGGGALAITPDQAPVAKVTTQARCAVASFDASASTVRYGSIVRYAWTFGDGKTAVTTTPHTTHSYASSGIFARSSIHKITVTETDSAGTSTQQVSTGQTMTANGAATAVAAAAVVTTTGSARC